jgi:hypothetical protein
MNSPFNKIKDQVIQYMSSVNYLDYTKTVFPLDRVLKVYEFNHRNITDLLKSNLDVTNLDDRAIDQRNEVLNKGIVYIHNYLSSQFSLLEILKRHSGQLPLKNQLLSEQKKLMNKKITKFFSDLRNNILHQTNFAPSLRYDAKWGQTKIVYPIDELLKSERWKNSKGFILTFGDHLIIEDLINQYHNYMTDFISQYEVILFDGNRIAFHEVITTLLGFSKQYNDLGEKGFLPVSESYLAGKLKFFPL